MDKRKIPARFEKSNVIDPHDPTFDIVSQENEIIAAKQLSWLVSLTHRIESRQPFRFFSECHYNGRMVASIDGKIALRKRYPNTSSMQSGENLIDLYGRKRCTKHDTNLETRSLPDFRRTRDVPRGLRNCD